MIGAQPATLIVTTPIPTAIRCILRCTCALSATGSVVGHGDYHPAVTLMCWLLDCREWLTGRKCFARLKLEFRVASQMSPRCSACAQHASLIIFQLTCTPHLLYSVTRSVVGHDYHHPTVTLMCGFLGYRERIAGSKCLARSKLGVQS